MPPVAFLQTGFALAFYSNSVLLKGPREGAHLILNHLLPLRATAHPYTAWLWPHIQRHNPTEMYGTFKSGKGASY